MRLRFCVQRLVAPTTVTGIHALAQFFLFGVFIVVLLDGPGTVARHFGDVGNRSARIEFAGDKRASCCVPRHFLVDAQNLANLVQCYKFTIGRVNLFRIIPAVAGVKGTDLPSSK